jgi:hypothetical protein
MKHLPLSAFAAMLLLIGGCWYAFQAEDEGDLVLESAGMTALKVETRNGHVTAAAWDSTGAAGEYKRRCRGSSTEEAREHLADIVLSDTLISGELRVKADCPDEVGRSYGCDFGIFCPGSTFDISTSNGAVEVTGLGPGTLETSNGAVTVTDATGPVSIETSNGRFTAVRHVGALTAHTSNGALDCEIISLDSLTDNVELSTSNGRVTVNLPATASLTFDLRTSNNDVTITGFPNVTYTTSERTHKKGKLNGGRMTLRVETSNGDLDIIGH